MIPPIVKLLPQDWVVTALVPQAVNRSMPQVDAKAVCSMVVGSEVVGSEVVGSEVVGGDNVVGGLVGGNAVGG